MFRFLTVMLLVLLALPAFAAPVPKLMKKKPLRAKIEPRPGEKLYTADFDDVPFAKVAEWYEKHSQLMFITRDKPEQLKITLRAEDVCLAELFAQLDDVLYPQGWVMPRKKQSFCTIAVTDLARYTAQFPLIDLDELGRRSQYEPVQVVLGTNARGIKAGLGLAEGMQENGFQVKQHGTDKLLVQGRANDVRKLVDDLGDHVKK